MTPFFVLTRKLSELWRQREAVVRTKRRGSLAPSLVVPILICRAFSLRFSCCTGSVHEVAELERHFPPRLRRGHLTLLSPYPPAIRPKTFS